MKTQAHELTEKQKEYLLILAEECSEVIKVVSKTFRFGLESKNPHIPNSPTNKEELVQEIGDIFAMVELLKNSPLGITDDSIRIAKEHKIKKLEYWLNNKD